MKQDGAYWIEKLQLKAHVEGGFFKEIYRSSLTVARTVLPSRFKGDRSFLTSIYFLLQRGQFSAFHRIASDETWHFYAGDCLVIYEIRPDGTLAEHRLGSHAGRGELFQVTIQAGNWFAARILDAGAFALTGCTVSPGFDFADFDLASTSQLVREFPQHRLLIESLTRGG
jgi:predicted cupin superfamily sugar epimerase